MQPKSSLVCCAGLLLVVSLMTACNRTESSAVAATSKQNKQSSLNFSDSQSGTSVSGRAGGGNQKKACKPKRDCDDDPVPAVELESISPVGGSFTPICPSIADGEPWAGGEIVTVLNAYRKEPVTSRIVVKTPFEQDTVYRISSTDTSAIRVGPDVASLGTQVIVTMPAGQLATNNFKVRGEKVSQQTLTIERIATDGSIASTTNWTVNVWEISEDKRPSDIVDYGALGHANVCFDQTNPPTLVAGGVRKTCGKRPDYVAADGVSRLLLRVRSGMQGKACFKVVADDGKDVGKTDPEDSTNVASDASTGNPRYAFGTYVAPDKIDSDEKERTIQIEIAFTPDVADNKTTTLAVRREIKIRRPPLLLVHGYNGNPGSGWGDAFAKPTPADLRAVSHIDYSAMATESAAEIMTSNIFLDAFASAQKKAHDEKMALTTLDVGAHSYGGLLMRAFANDVTNYKRTENMKQGWVHKLATVVTPHWGTQMANFIVHMVDNYPDADATHALMLMTNPTRGGMCDQAENSPFLSSLGESPFPAVVLAGSAGTPNTLGPADHLFVWPWWTTEELIAEVYPYRFREEHDDVVTVSSQLGGLSGQIYNGVHNSFWPDWVDIGVPEIPEAASFVFGSFDYGSGGFASLPLVPSNGLGVTRDPLVGGNPETQSYEYSVHCGAGGSMRQ